MPTSAYLVDLAGQSYSHLSTRQTVAVTHPFPGESQKWVITWITTFALKSFDDEEYLYGAFLLAIRMAYEHLDYNSVLSYIDHYIQGSHFLRPFLPKEGSFCVPEIVRNPAPLWGVAPPACMYVCVCVCCFVLFGQMCRCGVFITFALCAQSQRRLCIPRSWKGIIGRKVKTWRRKQKLCSKKEIQQVQMPHQMLGGLCWYVAEQRNTAVELKLSFSKPKPLRTHHQWSCCSCLASGNFDMQQTHLGCVLCIIQCNFTSCVLLKTCRNLHNKCSWGHGGSGCLAHPAIWSRPCEKSYCYPMNRKKALLLPDIVLVKMAIRFTRFTIKGLQSRSEAASLGINGYKVSIPWRTRRAHTHKHWDK